MPTAPRLLQNAHEIVRLDNWALDQDNPFGLPGAKPKQIFVCPNPAPHPFLIGGHQYLFKEPQDWRAPQIWSEIIAYELSRDLGIPVPPAFLASGPGNGSPGVLIEFFYGYPDEQKPRYVDAIELLQGLGFDINFDRGSLLDNIRLCRQLGIRQWKNWWAKTIALDALIGNVDRHSQNWGALIRPTTDGRTEYSMAPAFDNGTSLGYNFPDSALVDRTRPAAIARLVAQGKHHFGWMAGDAQSAQHAELCRSMARHVPGGIGTLMDDAANLADDRIEALMEWCCRFNFAVPFSAARANFVAAQLKARRHAIRAALGYSI